MDSFIERITNLAQEKNINWLGETNIEAMKQLLEQNKQQEKIIDNMAKFMAGGNRFIGATSKQIKEQFEREADYE